MLEIHAVQSWIVGQEVTFLKTHHPYAGKPILKRINSLANRSVKRKYTEKLDLTKARAFRLQETSESMLFASVCLPVIGKSKFGNDIALAVATFEYEDLEGDIHLVLAICAYEISGSVSRERNCKNIVVVPLGDPIEV